MILQINNPIIFAFFIFDILYLLKMITNSYLTSEGLIIDQLSILFIIGFFFLIIFYVDIIVEFLMLSFQMFTFYFLTMFDLANFELLFHQQKVCL